MNHVAEPSRARSGHPPHRVLRWILCCILAVAVLPLPAQDAPQTADEGEETTAGTAEGRGIQEEVRVTARKREENVQEVPVAVTVVQGEQLEDAGAEDISDLQIAVPNLSIYAGRNQSTTLTAFMRGVGQADPLWGVDPGVGLYLDDVYIARPQGALLDVYDVGRIEVLRGPQGTLYGKNTIGGTIKYVSKELTDTPEGYVSLTLGQYQNQDVKHGISCPLVEGKLRGKIAFASLKHEGYGDNVFTGKEVSDKDTQAYRAALDWLPSDKVKLAFSFDKTEDKAQPKGLTRLAANPFCPLFLGEPCNPLPDLFDTQSGLDPANGTESEGLSVTATVGMTDAWTFKSISAYRESDTRNNIDFDTTPARIADAVTTYYDDQTSQEFQFVYDGGGKLNGVFGAYYFDGEAGGKVNTVFFDSTFSVTDGFVQTESLAVFGDGSYEIGDQLTFNFGLRYTDEEKTGDVFNGLATDDTFSTIAVVSADFVDSETFSSLSPRLGFDYKFTDDVMGYLTLSRGFKSGGFNVRAQSNFFPESALPFDDEVLTVAEVGLKSLLADRSLILNAAVFYGDYADIQVSTFTAYDSDGDGTDDAFFGNFLNAGDATLTGAELEFDWRPREVSWFGLTGNLSYLDADPDSFLDANGDRFVDTQVITNAPELTGALNLNFYGRISSGLITATVSYGYRDESVLTNEGGEDPLNPGQPLLPLVQDSYGIWNARVGWLHKSGTFGVTINGKNLGDEEYLTNGYNLPVLGIFQGSYGQPLTVTATVDYKFF